MPSERELSFMLGFVAQLDFCNSWFTNYAKKPLCSHYLLRLQVYIQLLQMIRGFCFTHPKC